MQRRQQRRAQAEQIAVWTTREGLWYSNSSPTPVYDARTSLVDVSFDARKLRLSAEVLPPTGGQRDLWPGLQERAAAKDFKFTTGSPAVWFLDARGTTWERDKQGRLRPVYASKADGWPLA
jgi:hypothetical protein